MIVIFPEILRCLEQDHPEELAALVRRYFAGEQASSHRPDLIRLIRNTGIQISERKTPCHGVLLTKDLQGKASAYILFTPEKSHARTRFLLAHLLGHFFLEIQTQITGNLPQSQGIGESISPLTRYESQIYESMSKHDIEKRADLFAASLLMPATMFTKARKTFADDEKTARFFLVSPEAVRRRAEQLNLSFPVSDKVAIRSPSSDELSQKQLSRPQPLTRLRKLAKKLDHSVKA